MVKGQWTTFLDFRRSKFRKPSPVQRHSVRVNDQWFIVEGNDRAGRTFRVDDYDEAGLTYLISIEKPQEPSPALTPATE